MLFNIPLGELAWLAAAIMAGGVVAGFLAGLFGIGGGAIIVPVLYEVFRAIGVPEDVRMQICVGTSLAIIVPTTIRSFLGHRARGSIMPEVMRAWFFPSLLGVIAGSLLSGFFSQAVFKIAFVVLAAIVASKLLFGGDKWRLGENLPQGLGLYAYGFAIGVATSLMGVSGGSMFTMVLTLYARPIHLAVGTSAGLGVPITVAGTIGYMIAGWPFQAVMPPLSIGFVSLIGVALMAPVSSFVAIFGVRAAHALPRRQLEIALGLFMLAISVRFLVSLF